MSAARREEAVEAGEVASAVLDTLDHHGGEGFAEGGWLGEADERAGTGSVDRLGGGDRESVATQCPEEFVDELRGLLRDAGVSVVG